MVARMLSTTGGHKGPHRRQVKAQPTPISRTREVLGRLARAGMEQPPATLALIKRRAVCQDSRPMSACTRVGTCPRITSHTAGKLRWGSSQRRAILGEQPKHLLDAMDPAWRVQAGRLLGVWSLAVRASSAVENWHSIVCPHLAVHRSLSAGMLALLAVWHNHRIAPREVHEGLSPLQRSDRAKGANDWLVALGYPLTARFLL